MKRYIYIYIYVQHDITILSPPTKVAHALLSFSTGDANGAGNLLYEYGLASTLLPSVHIALPKHR